MIVKEIYELMEQFHVPMPDVDLVVYQVGNVYIV